MVDSSWFLEFDRNDKGVLICYPLMLFKELVTKPVSTAIVNTKKSMFNKDFMDFLGILD